MVQRIPTEADTKVAVCLAEQKSFAMIAGAGAGKTSSLVAALELIRSEYGSYLRKNGQKVACITFTKRAVQVISNRLGIAIYLLFQPCIAFCGGRSKRLLMIFEQR